MDRARRAPLLLTVIGLVQACSGLPPATTSPVTTPQPTATLATSPTPGAWSAPGTVEAARADLQKLVKNIESRNPGLLTDTTEWRAAIDRLDELLLELIPDHPERVLVEFMRLAALPGVLAGRLGHVSAVAAGERPTLAIVTYTFSDGVYVIRALPDQRQLLGGRVTAIAGHPIDEVRALLEPLVPRDNQYTPGVFLIGTLHQVEVLVGLDIVDEIGPVEFTVEMPDGEARTASVPLRQATDQLEPAPEPLYWLSEAAPSFLEDMYLPQRPEPLSTSRMGESLWWTVLEDGRTLYVQQNLMVDDDTPKYAEIIAAARAPTIERVILDLRHNLGGDPSPTSDTFRDPAINQPGRLYVIVGPRVFSASVPTVDELERFSEAILVGEPIGGAPGGWERGPSFTLSGLPIPMSIDLVRLIGSTDRLTVEPDILVPLTGADYYSGRDAALETILGP